MEEQWKVYKKTKLTLWEISDMGNMKKNGQPYICCKSNTGYYHFSRVFLHRAVAELFVPNPDPEHNTCVDHIDGDRLNNKSSNLRWVTHKENMNNPISRKRESESHIGLQAGENNPMYNKHHSEESKKKISAAQKGEKHHMYGKHLSGETKKKISESLKGKKHHQVGHVQHHSEETKIKIRNSHVLKPVVCLKNDQMIKIYDAIQDVKKDGFNIGHVCLCCQGKQKSHKGFNWMYLSDYEKRQG